MAAARAIRKCTEMRGGFHHESSFRQKPTHCSVSDAAATGVPHGVSPHRGDRHHGNLVRLSHEIWRGTRTRKRGDRRIHCTRGRSRAVVGMAANPSGAHQAGRHRAGHRLPRDAGKRGGGGVLVGGAPPPNGDGLRGSASLHVPRRDPYDSRWISGGRGTPRAWHTKPTWSFGEQRRA